jgi:hypothetical protein
MTKLLTACAVLTLALAPTAMGDLLLYEGFDYTAHPLGSADGGEGWTSAWGDKVGNSCDWTPAASSLTYSTLPISGVAYGDQTSTGKPAGARSWLNGVTGFDQDAGTIWFSFLIKVQDFGGSGQWVNFTGGNNYGRGFGVKIDGGKLQAHMAYDGTTGDDGPEIPNSSHVRTFGATHDMNADETYMIVGKMVSDNDDADGAQDTLSLWVNPISLGSELVDGDDAAFYDVIAGHWGPEGNNLIAQFGGGGDPAQFLIDEIRIGETGMDVLPEPTTMALLGLGGLAVLRRRRA